MAPTLVSVSKLFLVEKADRELVDALASAGRTSRVVADALQAKRQVRTAALLAAVLGSLAAGGLAAATLAVPASLPATAIAAAGAGLVAAAAACFAMLDERSKALEQIALDHLRCEALLRQLRALRRSEEQTAVVQEIAPATVAELREIGGRYPGAGDQAVVRRHERIEARNRPLVLAFPNGTKQIVTVRDISRSGVAVNTDAMIKIGVVLTLGSTPARAVRSLPGGMAFEFLRPFPRDGFSPDVTL